MTDHYLAVKNLQYDIMHRFLFKDINFELELGASLHIIGDNGSGKTTLLRLLATLLPMQQGEIYYLGDLIQQQYARYRQAIHYIGHQLGITTSLTVYENIIRYCRIFAITASSQIIQQTLSSLKLCNIAHQPAKSLSAGQLQRLAFARLLITDRLLWLLDEPFTALDSQGQQILLALMDQHQAKGGMIIFASHQNLPLAKLQTVTIGEVCIS